MDNKTQKSHPEKDQILNVRGLNCPLPLLKAKVLLNKMQAGEILYIEATDPHSAIDFEAYCARTNHKLISVHKNGEIFEFYIQKVSRPNQI